MSAQRSSRRENEQLERERLERIRAGNAGEFESLFKDYYAELRAFVGTYVDRATSEEVIQELFLALWRKRESWNPAGGVRAYLFAAARNQALNVIRQTRNASKTVEACAIDGSMPSADQANPTPAQQFYKTEIEAACRNAIHELPESSRLAMMLRWHYGMSHAEIAFVLGTSIKGVEAELGRGLRALGIRLSWLRG
jgi:RNA polymerase sigma-70 factor (ECF subfamily)